MSGEPYKSIDVKVFGDILNRKYFIDETDEQKQDELIDIIKKIHTVEIIYNQTKINWKKEFDRIDVVRYGFKCKEDVKFEYKQKPEDDASVIYLVPNKIYELEDKIELKEPYCEKGKQLLLVLSDAFERLKVKAMHVLQACGEDKHIAHYANKNMQVAQRICYDARIRFSKIQSFGSREAIYSVYLQNIFMINVVQYLNKMFSQYYKGVEFNKDKARLDLYDLVDLNMIMEAKTAYGAPAVDSVKSESEPMPICPWNGQTNSLVTLFYDLMHTKTEEGDKNLLGASPEIVTEMIHSIFSDKNGKIISKHTIATILKEYRDEKRAKGKKRIDVDPYKG